MIIKGKTSLCIFDLKNAALVNLGDLSKTVVHVIKRVQCTMKADYRQQVSEL